MSDPETRVFVQRVAIALALLVAVGGALTLVALYPQVPLTVFASILGAILLDGLSRPLRRWARMGRAAAVSVAALVVAGALFAVFWFSGPQIVRQGSLLIEQIPHSLGAIESSLARSPGLRSVWPAASKASEQRLLLGAVGRLANSVTDLASRLTILLAGLLAVAVLAFFLAIQPSLYVEGALRLVPRRRRGRAREVLDAVVRALRWWLVGRFSAMVAIGLLTLIGLFAMGIQLALVLSLVAALFTFVPYLGPVLGAAPAVMVGLVQSPMTALWIAVLYAGVQLSENNLVTPLIQLRAVSLPPAVLMVAQLMMGVLFGLLGLLLATPLTVTVIVLIQTLYVQDVLGEPVQLLGEGHRLRRDSRLGRLVRHHPFAEHGHS